MLLKLKVGSSQTLLHDKEARACWIKAASFIEESENIFRIDEILKLHLLLNQEAGFRQVDVEAGFSQFPTPDKIEPLFSQFLEHLKTIESDISKAAFIYQVICSIHPFVDANARIARLMANSVLIKTGNLAVIFPDQASGFVIPKDHHQDYHAMALKRVLQSANWIYQLFSRQ